MYVEALRALERNDGLEAHHVAAYELREMMQALPTALDLPVVRHTQVTDRIRLLSKRWKTCSDQSACLTGSAWGGVLDEPLRRFLQAATEFFVWFEEDVPSRRRETALVLSHLLPADYPMPQPLVDKRTAEWKHMLDYFNSVTHHDKDATEAEFLRELGELEAFLLEHLAPRTFEDQDEIDRLVLEAEA